MNDVQHELRWKIDAYSAETMPLDRLLEYLGELSTMLGEGKSMHLLKVESSSTVPVLRVDPDAVQIVRQRAVAVRSGMAPVAAMQSYRRINRMLKKDDAQASLVQGGAEIIQFPGKSEQADVLSGITQRGTLDGKLERVGGANEQRLPVALRSLEGTSITGCYAKKDVAEQLGGHLFKPVRLYGRGRWSRTATGQWVMDSFRIETFERLSSQTLTEVVAALRNLNVHWSETPIANLRESEL